LFALTAGPFQAVIVLVALVIYHQFESHLLLPRVYGQSLRLSPLAVIVALLVGEQLLGIVGALLALPMAAGIRVLIENYRIELPGELPGEREERVEEADAELAYATQTQGTSSVESAMMATEIAEQLQEVTEAETGRLKFPSRSGAIRLIAHPLCRTRAVNVRGSTNPFSERRTSNLEPLWPRCGNGRR
jgi:hypothetical protein